MRWLTNLVFRLKALFGSRRMERDLDDEVAFHLEMETNKLTAQGMSAREARREARRRFGGQAHGRERVREAWGIGFITDVKADVVHTARQFRRHPGFAGISIGTLALGIGATVALFSVVYGLMLRPLPFADEERLAVFWSQFDWRGVEFDFTRERVTAYDGIAAYSLDAVPLQTESGTSLLLHTIASAELFDVLGARPLLGRTFAPGEDRPGAEPVIVLSHALWRQDLGGDSTVVGSRLSVGGVPTTVIGVMPEGFYFPSPEFRAWRPLSLDPAAGAYHGNGFLTLIGRVRTDVTAGAVDGDLQSLATALGDRFEYPEAWDKSQGAHLTTMRQYLLGDVRPALLLLLGAVGLLLLMASANAAALILARTTDRVGEMAVRVALGAGRGRIARQVLTESVVLGLVAGLVGAGLARGLFDTLVATLPLEGGFGEALRFTWPTFAVAFGLASVVGLVVAVAPLRHVWTGRLQGLHGTRTERGQAPGTGRAHGGLVAAEVLLAVTLVTGAALLIRSVARLQSLDLGIEPAGVVTMDLVAGGDQMDDAGRRAFFLEIERQAGALPGVRSAGLVARLPIRDGGWQGPVTVEGRPDLDGPARPNSYWRPVTPDYFRTMGIRLRGGRVFDARDRTGTLPVTIVSETFAQRMWPGEDAVGRRVSSGISSGEWLTVVGVVVDVRLVSVTGDVPPVMYVPVAQSRFTPEGLVLVLNVDGNAAAVVPGVRRLVRDTDPRVAVWRAGTMETVIAAALAEPLRLRFFLMLFAGLGLVLGAVGIYGVVSYAVTRRRAEFGIRMALGATSSRVLAEVVRHGMIPVVTGVIGGIGVSLALSRVLTSFLHGVAPTDPVSLAAAAGVLLLVGVGAAVVPAWRAGRVNPVEVLKVE